MHVAAVIFWQGFPLVNVDRPDSAKCPFVFCNSYDLEELVERFNSKKPVFVEAHPGNPTRLSSSRAFASLNLRLAF